MATVVVSLLADGMSVFVPITSRVGVLSQRWYRSSPPTDRNGNRKYPACRPIVELVRAASLLWPPASSPCTRSSWNSVASACTVSRWSTYARSAPTIPVK